MKRPVSPSSFARVFVTGCLIACGAVAEVNATTCGAPPQVLEAADEAEAVFVGEIAHGGAAHHPVACAIGWVRSHLGLEPSVQACETGYITFRVLEKLKGDLNSEATFMADTPVVFNDWFKVGAQLLIYAQREPDGQLSIPMCGRSKFLSDAGDDLTALRARYGGDQ